jgi:predicted permease
VAFGLHRWLVALLPLGPGTALPFRLDTRMLAFNTSVSVLAGVLVGIAPALRALRLSPAAVFRAEAPARPRLGRLLRPALAAQVAASLVLLIGTAMFIRTLTNLLDVNTGFDSAHTLLVAIDPEECHLTPESTTALAEDLAARVRGLPGVRAAAIAAWADVSDMSGSHKTMWVDGVDKNVTVIDRAGFGVVSPQFFAANGVTLVAGRDFDVRDRKGAPTVAIVNQAMAERYYRGANPIGRRIGDGPGRAAGMDTYEIVGVVGNARHGGLRRVPRPMVFHALAQQPDNRPFVLHVRGAGDPKALVAAVRASVHVTDPRLVIADTRTVSERLAESLRQERMFAVLSALFAGVGLVLSSVGLFAAAANAVQRRRREIGIRLALGAARDKVVALMLKETLVTVGAGAALGLPVAVFCASFLRSLLFGVAPTDIGVIVTAVATLVGAAALATFVPARRASRVDPAAALRCE